MNASDRRRSPEGQALASESCQEERLSRKGSSVLGVCREGLPFLPSLLCVGLYVVVFLIVSQFSG